MNVITLKPHRYKNKQMKPGEKYDFKGRAERRLAIALGWVKRTFDDHVVEHEDDLNLTITDVGSDNFTINIVEKVEKVQEKYEGETVESTYKPKRTYKRRDMVADE